MRVIPSVVKTDTPESEKRVFGSLLKIDIPDGICFHSLNLPDHVYKKDGESDFVLVTKRGILVLEVKGGEASVSPDTGYWNYGIKKTSGESPFNQAKGNMYSLKERLFQNSVTPFLNNTLFGYGVIFTDTLFRKESIEWNRKMWLDTSGFHSSEDLKTFIDTLYSYYEEKFKARPMSVKDIEAVSDYLRPSFDLVKDLKSSISNNKYLVNELTENQYRKLDLIEKNPRILISGGAGTGKTYLATEVARRHVMQGEKVLYTCMSTLLSKFISDRLRQENVDVYPIDDLVDKTNKVKYDVIVIDEGQDILEWNYIQSLDLLLKNGLEHGKWRLFHDINNQKGLFGSTNQEVYDYMCQLSPTMAALSDNCRNTAPIILQTSIVTDAELGKSQSGGGLPVSWKFFTTNNGASSTLSEIIDDLENQDISPLNTVLLVESLDEGTRNFLKNAIGDTFVYMENHASYIHNSKIRVAEIRQFKGLESDVVIVMARSKNLPNINPELLYVAMSRCKSKLYMIMHESKEAEMIDKFTNAGN